MTEATKRFSLQDVTSLPIDSKSHSAGPTSAEVRVSDEAAHRAGFVSREPQQMLKRTVSKEPMRQVSVRLPVTYANRLVRYCEDNRYTYGDLLMKLMDENQI